MRSLFCSHLNNLMQLCFSHRTERSKAYRTTYSHLSDYSTRKGQTTVSDGYQEMYLGYHDHPKAITPQAFAQIEAIIQASLICTYCLTGYTPANPQVAENVCLACLQKRRSNSPTNLSFVGEVPS